jgi:hypothetical protein
MIMQFNEFKKYSTEVSTSQKIKNSESLENTYFLFITTYSDFLS